jgi:hypothetical protein
MRTLLQLLRIRRHANAAVKKNIQIDGVRTALQRLLVRQLRIPSLMSV